MRVLIFNESTAVKESLDTLFRSRRITVDCKPREDVRKWVQLGESYDLVYVDVNGLNTAERRRLLKYVLRRCNTPIGVLDPYDEVLDPAYLFHTGVVDYAGSALVAEELTAARITRVLEWSCTGTTPGAGSSVPRVGDSSESESAIVPGDLQEKPGERSEGGGTSDTIETRAPEHDFPLNPVPLDNLIHGPVDWAAVRGDQEYTFVVLYVGLDVENTVTRDASTELVNNSVIEFQKVLQEIVEPYNGRLWFWKELSGIILFPFDGVSGDSIVAAMRIMLRRLFWQAEQKTNFVTKHFHMAMHVGNLVYHQGVGRETMVSDLVNFLFHLGGSYAPKNEFILSRDILSRCPPGLRRFFRRHGSFKGVEIWCMQRPLTPRESAESLEHNTE